MEMQVIKDKPTRELQEHEEKLRAQLFALRIQKVIGKLEASHKISELRKDIARIKTELSARKILGEKIVPLNITKIVLPDDNKTTTVKQNTIKTKKINKLALNTKMSDKKVISKPVTKRKEKQNDQ